MHEKERSASETRGHQERGSTRPPTMSRKQLHTTNSTVHNDGVATDPDQREMAIVDGQLSWAEWGTLALNSGTYRAYRGCFAAYSACLPLRPARAFAFLAAKPIPVGRLRHGLQHLQGPALPSSTPSQGRPTISLSITRCFWVLVSNVGLGATLVLVTSTRPFAACGKAGHSLTFCACHRVSFPPRTPLRLPYL